MSALHIGDTTTQLPLQILNVPLDVHNDEKPSMPGAWFYLVCEHKAFVLFWFTILTHASVFQEGNLNKNWKHFGKWCCPGQHHSRCLNHQRYRHLPVIIVLRVLLVILLIVFVYWNAVILLCNSWHLPNITIRTLNWYSEKLCVLHTQSPHNFCWAAAPELVMGLTFYSDYACYLCIYTNFSGSERNFFPVSGTGERNLPHRRWYYCI